MVNKVNRDIVKRDGTIVQYDGGKVIQAIERAMNEDKQLGIDNEISRLIEKDIFDDIHRDISIDMEEVTVEDLQNFCEIGLLKYGRVETARDYIKYRGKHEEDRERLENWKPYKSFRFLSDEFLKQYSNNPNPFESEISKFTFYRTYSRFLDSEKRRETWLEMNARVADYMTELEPYGDSESAELLFDNLFKFKVFSSGRIRYTGGTESIRKNFQSAFNCSGIKIDNVDKFSETMMLLLLGCGVGYSVYKEDIEKLQPIRQDIEVVMKSFTPVPKSDRQELTTTKLHDNTTMEIIIGDSKTAWCGAIQTYFDITTNRGMSSADRVIKAIRFNFDNIRPKGERLKTFGGTASGYEPLMKTLQGIHDVILNTKGSKITRGRIRLKSIDVLDIMALIAESVVSGGVRRSSLLTLIDPNDEEVKGAKKNLYTQENGNWVVDKSLLHRQMSNNTIMYREKPTRDKLHNHIQEMRYNGEPKLLWVL